MKHQKDESERLIDIDAFGTLPGKVYGDTVIHRMVYYPKQSRQARIHRVEDSLMEAERWLADLYQGICSRGTAVAVRQAMVLRIRIIPQLRFELMKAYLP